MDFIIKFPLLIIIYKVFDSILIIIYRYIKITIYIFIYKIIIITILITLFINQIICKFSMFKRIITDWGLLFINNFWSKFYYMLKIK